MKPIDYIATIGVSLSLVTVVGLFLPSLTGLYKIGLSGLILIGITGFAILVGCLIHYLMTWYEQSNIKCD